MRKDFSVEHHAAPSGGWSTCVRRGQVEIWFAGGPRIGRLGYTFTSRAGADAAVGAECRLLDIELDQLLGARLTEADRRTKAALTAIIEANRCPPGMQASSEGSRTDEDFDLVSLRLDGAVVAYMVAASDTGSGHPFVGGVVTDPLDAEAIVAAVAGRRNAPPV